MHDVIVCDVTGSLYTCLYRGRVGEGGGFHLRLHIFTDSVPFLLGVKQINVPARSLQIRTGVLCCGLHTGRQVGHHLEVSRWSGSDGNDGYESAGQD